MKNTKFQNLNLEVSSILNHRGGDYNEVSTYLMIYGRIPSRIHLMNTDCRKLKERIERDFAPKPQQKVSISRVVDLESQKIEEDDLLYFLDDEILLCLDTNRSRSRILFPENKKENALELQVVAEEYKAKAEDKVYINLINRSVNDLNTQSLEIQVPDSNIADNYNDDFLPVHEHILKRLQTKNDKGIVLLHGKPGTGKTSYIRQIIKEVKKEVIFLPPAMAGALTEPGLISILTDNPNSIFVIEDAERILVAREQEQQSPVSTLLNISDGLLADCLNIQIICSFNTDLSKVDRALLRKGRLIAKYDFRELSSEKAQKLNDKLGKNRKIDRPLCLSEIYHPEDLDFQVSEKQAIGFL